MAAGDCPEAVLARLLEASHTMAPDDLAPAVRALAPALGATDAVIRLVDLGQEMLVAVDGAGAEGDAVEVEGTLAGRAFQSSESLAGAGRLWVPLLDGTERLGVVEVAVEDPDADQVGHWEHFASLVAQLVVSKSQYGDALVLPKRKVPLDLAAELRWSFLPPLTLITPRVTVAGVLEPAYEIAGDSFDYALNGDTVHLAILDAMGHGLEASRMANLAVGSYRNSRRRSLDLAGMFLEIDRVISDQFGEDKFVTGQLARLDVSTGSLEWINAGHPRPLLVRGIRSVDVLSCEPCLPFGLGDVESFSAQTQLEPGDSVLFFTDGMVEGRGPDDDVFGTERLADLFVRGVLSQQQPAETVRRLVRAVVEHQGGDVADDATLLMVTWAGPNGEDEDENEAEGSN